MTAGLLLVYDNTVCAGRTKKMVTTLPLDFTKNTYLTASSR